jgi:diadenosine tetraphosphatase ApaH/serine/threonine PP2A family protein phosphatase
MRIAIFSDIHGNLEALLAVLEDTTAQQCELRYCLGDCVGYGANPGECIKTLRTQKIFTVRGNHDHDAALDTPLDNYNAMAAEALRWTRAAIKSDDRAWLGSLAYRMEVPQHGIILCHASAHRPEDFRYVTSSSEAYLGLLSQDTRVSFVGHTHCPELYALTQQTQVEHIPVDSAVVPLRSDKVYMVNVGSLGQPRDGDPQSCYVVYDTESESVTFRRVKYPIAQAQEKIRKAGLPEVLAWRLSVGQ